MPPLQLDDEAKNFAHELPLARKCRQLKNITEQISIIEQNRDITAEVLKSYLPCEFSEKSTCPFIEK